MCACRDLTRLTRLGMEALNFGDHSTAIERLNEALRRAEDLGSIVLQAKAHNNLGLVHLTAGDATEAEACFALAKEKLARRIGVENRLYRSVEANHSRALARNRPYLRPPSPEKLSSRAPQ